MTDQYSYEITSPQQPSITAMYSLFYMIIIQNLIKLNRIKYDNITTIYCCRHATGSVDHSEARGEL